MIGVEIAPNHNAFNAGHCNSDHVVDVRQELSNSDRTFLNVLGGLRFPITVSNQIAL
jgi:anthranilate phosphoribosyltransferase